MAGLTLDKIGARDIARIEEMLLWEQFLLSQTCVDRAENSLITDGSRSRLDMSDQLWSLFIADLAEMHLIADEDAWIFSCHSGRPSHRES